MASGSMSAVPNYSYEPFEDASQEIRLLRILPPTGADPDDVVSVSLEHFRLEKSLVYDALSYTWGDASKTKAILVNGCRFDATENLHAALIQLRSFKPREGYSRNELIWIDALCINQKDDNEKSLQVQMMRDIFGNAAQVIVWLGILNQDSHSGLKTIALLADAYKSYISSQGDNFSKGTEDYEKLLGVLKEFDSRNYESKGNLILSIKQIFQLPWWDRVWIIQEVAVAKKAWVIFGPDILGFEYFRDLFSAINKLDKIPDADVATGWSLRIKNIRGSAYRVQSVLKTWLNDETTLLQALQLLFVAGTGQATDPRDRFYALIGLRVDVEAIVGKVDYSIPWKELYTKAARALLREHGLAVLSFCAPERERQYNGLPSWVPDWTQNIALPTSFRSSSTLYSASVKTNQPVPNADGNDEVRLSGAIVGKIRELGDLWPLPPNKHNSYSWEEGIVAMKTWNQNIKILASSLSLMESEQDDLVMRVTSADLCEDKRAGLRRLRSDDKPAYKAFLRLVSLPLPSGLSFSYEDVMDANAVASNYYTGLLAAADTKRPFLSDAGHLGIAPKSAEFGDIVCIFYGAYVPFVLRPEGNGRYRLLGEAYVDGIMDGQFMDTEHADEIFVLI